MNTVYKFSNEHIGLEIRRSGEGLNGYWIVQTASEELNIADKRLPTQLHPSVESAVSEISYGRVYRAWDGAKLNQLGVPATLSGWHPFENDLGALDA